jgi:hypothetical protein
MLGNQLKAVEVKILGVSGLSPYLSTALPLSHHPRSLLRAGQGAAGGYALGWIPGDGLGLHPTIGGAQREPNLHCCANFTDWL